jgi:hypothetical protein
MRPQERQGDLLARPRGLGEAHPADRGKHELTDAETAVRAGASVEHAEDRDREHRSLFPAQVEVHRGPGHLCSHARQGQRAPDDGVEAESSLVVSAADADHRSIVAGLVVAVTTGQHQCDLPFHGRNRLQDPLTAKARRIPVVLLDGLAAGGRGAGRNCGAGAVTRGLGDLPLDGVVCPGFSGVQLLENGPLSR